MTTDKDVLEAADQLGKAIAACSETDRAIVAKLHSDVKEFATQQEAKGVLVDKSAFFAAGIIFHPEIESEELIAAAVNYVEKDWLFTKAEREQQPAG